MAGPPRVTSAQAGSCCESGKGECVSKDLKQEEAPEERTPQAEETQVNAPSESRSTEALQLARQQRLGAALELLERQPELWQVRDDDGHSLLHWGALLGNTDFVRCALFKGCPVDCQANNRQTPLMWAVLKGHLRAARVLLEAKADMHAKDSMGATPLIIAAQHQSHACMLLMLNRAGAKLFADRDNNGCTVAHWAAFKGDAQALKLLDYFDVDLMAMDGAKMQPLHRAVKARQHDAAQFLVEKGSDPYQKNGQGSSCLDLASQNADLRMEALLKKAARKKDGSEVDPEKGAPEQGDDSSGKTKSKKKQLMDTLMKDKQAQKAFPAFWLVCVSLSVFEYLMVIRPTGVVVAPISSVLFELGVPLSLAIFFWVAFADPGKLPSLPKGRSGMEVLMKSLDTATPADDAPDVSRLCTTTWVLKDLRTKYCTQTGACVEEFDHYCVWLNTAIGRGNHRQFICLAVTEWVTQILFVLVCWNVAWSLTETSSIGTLLFSLLLGYPLFAVILFLHVLTIPWVTMLVKQHVSMLGVNMTTNEMMNFQRYEHFWKTENGQRKFRNPFNKGGFWENHRDFWWTRRRGELKEQVSCCTKSGCTAC